MAVVNVQSASIDNAVATPVVKNSKLVSTGAVREVVDFVEFASSDATSVGRVFRIPSRARVSHLWYASDDLGTGGTIDIGLYSIAGGAVVDADFFASALDVDTAAVGWTEVTHESGVVNIDKSAKALWVQLGLSADPNILYDVAVTRNTATGSGTVALKMQYVTLD